MARDMDTILVPFQKVKSNDKSDLTSQVTLLKDKAPIKALDTNYRKKN